MDSNKPKHRIETMVKTWEQKHPFYWWEHKNGFGFKEQEKKMTICREYKNDPFLTWNGGEETIGRGESWKKKRNVSEDESWEKWVFLVFDL